MENYIKCGLISGGSPRYLNTFSNFVLLVVHNTYQCMLCIVANVNHTHVHHVVSITK